MHNESLDLAKYRLEKAEEKIKVAQTLYDMGAYLDCHNRTYYSIFNALRALLALDKVDYKRHSGVIQHFQREYILTGIFEKEYSNVVVKAYEIRLDADYEDFYILSKEDTFEQLENAKKFYNKVKEYIESIK